MELASTGLVSSLFSTTSVGELSRKWSFCPTMHRVFAHAAHFVRSFAFVEVRRGRKRERKGENNGEKKRETLRKVKEERWWGELGQKARERQGRGVEKRKKSGKDRKNENKTRKIEIDEEEE